MYFNFKNVLNINNKNEDELHVFGCPCVWYAISKSPESKLDQSFDTNTGSLEHCFFFMWHMFAIGIAFTTGF